MGRPVYYEESDDSDFSDNEINNNNHSKNPTSLSQTQSQQQTPFEIASLRNNIQHFMQIPPALTAQNQGNNATYYDDDDNAFIHGASLTEEIRNQQIQQHGNHLAQNINSNQEKNPTSSTLQPQNSSTALNNYSGIITEAYQISQLKQIAQQQFKNYITPQDRLI
ncbi:4966_t:CDS:2, partial [Ambispora gerdemannii]